MEKLSLYPILLVLCGGIYDLFTKRIPNWLTFSGMAIGLVAQLYFHAWAGGASSLLGMLVGLALFLPSYFFAYMGAGDVKLLMLVGAWLGPRICFETALASVAFGGIYALIDTLLRGRLYAVVYAGFRFLRALSVPQLEVEPLYIQKDRKFSFGLCLALGLILILYLHREGRL